MNGTASRVAESEVEQMWWLQIGRPSTTAHTFRVVDPNDQRQLEVPSPIDSRLMCNEWPIATLSRAWIDAHVPPGEWQLRWYSSNRHPSGQSKRFSVRAPSNHVEPEPEPPAPPAPAPGAPMDPIAMYEFIESRADRRAQQMIDRERALSDERAQRDRDFFSAVLEGRKPTVDPHVAARVEQLERELAAERKRKARAPDPDDDDDDDDDESDEDKSKLETFLEENGTPFLKWMMRTVGAEVKKAVAAQMPKEPPEVVDTPGEAVGDQDGD